MSNAMESARTAEMIAVEINVIKGQTRDVILRSAIEIGKRLYEAKTIVPYGRWGEWLKENVDYSERTAQNLMKCFDEYGKNPQTLADMSYSQAVALLSLDGEQRSELMERVNVSELSTRELQSEIARLKEEQAQRQVTLDQLLNEKNAAEEAAEAARNAAEAMANQQEENRKAVAAAVERSKDFAARADALNQENRALKRELENERAKPAPQPETVIEQVEVVPEAVQQELETLRKRSAELEDAAKSQREALENAERTAQRSEMEVRVREAYNSLVQSFHYVRTLLNALEQERADAAARYRRAVAKAAEKMAAEMNPECCAGGADEGSEGE